MMQQQSYNSLTDKIIDFIENRLDVSSKKQIEITILTEQYARDIYNGLLKIKQEIGEDEELREFLCRKEAELRLRVFSKADRTPSAAIEKMEETNL